VPRGIAKETLTAVTVGVVLGSATRIADSQENVLTWLGSLLAPWILAAFVVGSRSAMWHRAIAMSTATMVIGVIIYYAWWWIFDNGTGLGPFLLFWMVFAPVAGLVFGLAGWMWRAPVSHRLLPVTGVALSGGLIAGESVFFAFTAASLSAAELTLFSASITLGLMKPLVLLHGIRDRLTGFLMTACFLAAGITSVPIIRWLVEVIR
jgi:hypothetical protein